MLLILLHETDSDGFLDLIYKDQPIKKKIWRSSSGKQNARLVCGRVTQLGMHMQVTAGANLTAAVWQHLKESFPRVTVLFFTVFSRYTVALGYILIAWNWRRIHIM